MSFCTCRKRKLLLPKQLVKQSKRKLKLKLHLLKLVAVRRRKKNKQKFGNGE